MIQQIKEVVTRLSGKQSDSERLDDSRELARLAQRLVESLALKDHPNVVPVCRTCQILAEAAAGRALLAELLEDS